MLMLKAYRGYKYMKRKVNVVIFFFAAAAMLFALSIKITASEPRGEKALLNPYETVQTEIMENGGGFYEDDIQYSPISGAKILKAENVDFSKGLRGIEVMARTRWFGSEIDVYLDDLKSEPIARILVRSYSFNQIIGIPGLNVSGVHDVYFKANNPIDIATWKALPAKSYDGDDVPKIDPYKDNDAEINFGSSIKESMDKNRTVLAGFSEGDYFLMKDVNFEKGLNGIMIEAWSEGDGFIEVRENSSTGEIIGTIEIRESNDGYKVFEGEMSDLEGMKNIVFVGKKGSCNIDKWCAVPRNTDKPLPIPGENISPYGYVDAELDFSGENAEIIEDNNNKVVSIKENGYFSVEKVNLKYGLSSMAILAKSDEPTAVEIREGSAEGELLGVIKLDDTEGEYKYYSFVANNIEGLFDLFFICKVGSCRIDKWMVMSKMMPVPGNEPVFVGKEIDDTEKEHPELQELPNKPELPEESEKPELQEKAEQPDKTEMSEEPEHPDALDDCKLDLTYTRDIWGGGYRIDFKITNIFDRQRTTTQIHPYILDIRNYYI